MGAEIEKHEVSCLKVCPLCKKKVPGSIKDKHMNDPSMCQNVIKKSTATVLEDYEGRLISEPSPYEEQVVYRDSPIDKS